MTPSCLPLRPSYSLSRILPTYDFLLQTFFLANLDSSAVGVSVHRKGNKRRGPARDFTHLHTCTPEKLIKFLRDSFMSSLGLFIKSSTGNVSSSMKVEIA